MPPRSRREHGEPLVVQAARDRERHLSQVTSYGFLARRGPKRHVTVTPRPLRYWQYDPARAWVAAAVVLAVAVWLGFLGWRDGGAAATDEAPLAVGLGLLVLLGATGRFTIGDHAVSTDIAGLRQTSSFGVVPLVLITEVVEGRPPAGGRSPAPVAAGGPAGTGSASGTSTPTRSPRRRSGSGCATRPPSPSPSARHYPGKGGLAIAPVKAGSAPGLSCGRCRRGRPAGPARPG